MIFLNLSNFYFKIEISTGFHPYSRAKGVYELSALILNEESPRLDSKKFSSTFCLFTDKW